MCCASGYPGGHYAKENELENTAERVEWWMLGGGRWENRKLWYDD